MASENGWEPSHAPDELLEWVVVPGTNPPVRLRLMKGWPSTIMKAYAADYNEFVEKLHNDDSAAFTPTNSVATSNHLNGTAMDLNWEDHPFHVSYGGYTPAMTATMREMLTFYEKTMFWSQDWDSPKDCMHHQMGYGTWNQPWVLDFINRKIRADGFSTFRRGGTAAPPPPPAAVMTVPLVQNANGTWTSPSPAWAHLIRRESGGNPTIIQQIHDVNSGGNEAEGLFQITPRTWRAHHGDEFAPTARLATPQQQAIVAARIFTRNPSGSDWGAGLPGREKANELAAGLVPTTTQAPPVTGEEDMAAVPQEEWAQVKAQIDRVFHEVADLRISRSPVREPDEGPKDTWSGFLLNTDGSQHLEVCKILAGYGHPPTIALLKRVAAMDPNKPGREGDCYIAQAILAEATNAPAASPLQDGPAQQPQVVYLPAPIPEAAPVVDKTSDTGQAIGDLFNVLDRLRLADALPIETRAPLAALIGVLQTKNGAQL